MKISDIRADDETGPGYALIEFGDGSVQSAELAFFDLDRNEYLWPASGKFAIWRKQPNFFATVLTSKDPAIFRVGPEVCNYLQADSLIQITSRDGSLEGADIVWPGVPTLDTTSDVAPVIPAHVSDPHPATEFLPVARSAPAQKRSEAVPIENENPRGLENQPNGNVLPETALELDIGMAVISQNLTFAEPERSMEPELLTPQDRAAISPDATEFLSTRVKPASDEWLRWLIVGVIVSSILAAALIVANKRNSAAPLKPTMLEPPWPPQIDLSDIVHDQRELSKRKQ